MALTEGNASQPFYQIIQMFLVTTDFMMMRRRLKSALLKQSWRRLQSQLLISRNYFKFYVVEECCCYFWFGFQKFITTVAEVIECPTYLRFHFDFACCWVDSIIFTLVMLNICDCSASILTLCGYAGSQYIVNILWKFLQ